ncbi:LuxR C-terminal-related transcriptional regulator [Acidovorax sp. Leaf160]|uniref:helix-turn-helix transcriptional regulator n=1 Tax=Acidovorax sp. Leaf160 TaxID=1736280 RepID=UPI0006F5DCF8|nr:LuxR C-terminal-related transcriptional regulator [Acidovorax sp. Leaf160]KQR63274.1 hypothetical protein ASF94_01790 [Acidovorax sp. Leaf160]
MAQTPGMEDFSDLLLHVYRLAHEQPLHAFQDASLDALRRVLPFDSSMWGSATPGVAGIDIHTLHLDRQPAEMLSAYEAVKHLDTAAARVMQAPRATLGFDAAAQFGAPHQKAISAYGRRFGQRHFFITSTANPANGLTQWITLFRAHEGACGTERERTLLAAVAPHFHQAVGYNRMRHLEALAPDHAPGGDALKPAQGERAQAVADLRGTVYHATPAFDAMLRTEWSAQPARRLPPPLLQHFASGSARFAGHTLVVRCHVERDLMFVNARPRCAADQLTPREWQIGWLLAQGLSHKEIARRLDRAPATVRNHIQTIYRRLDVGSVAALIAELHAALD